MVGMSQGLLPVHIWMLSALEAKRFYQAGVCAGAKDSVPGSRTGGLWGSKMGLRSPKGTWTGKRLEGRLV